MTQPPGYARRAYADPIPFSLIRVDGPSGPSVSVADLKTHLRIDSTAIDEDDLIEMYALTADEAVESELCAALLTQAWELRLDRFPCVEVRLPRPPLSGVTSVRYVDVNGVTQTLDPAAYVVDTSSRPGRIHLPYGLTWPSTQAVPNAVTVSYTAGRVTQQEVPAMIQQAVMLTVGDLYENRERSAIEAVKDLPTYDRLMANHRTVWEFVYR